MFASLPLIVDGLGTYHQQLGIVGMVGLLSWGGSVAVAVCVSDM